MKEGDKSLFFSFSESISAVDIAQTFLRGGKSAFIYSFCNSRRFGNYKNAKGVFRTPFLILRKSNLKIKFIE